jgi:hypothetical protein
MERVLLDVAMQAFATQTGAPATRQSELMDHQLLRNVVSGVDIVDGKVVEVAGQSCRPALRKEQGMSANCASALIRLGVAASMFEQQKGFPPATSIEIGAAGFDVDGQLYEWNGGDVTPVAGEDCPAGSIHETDTAQLCRAEYKTLATATEAYAATTGGLPASEADLVTAELLRSEIVNFDLVVSGDQYEIVAVGDRCADFDPAGEQDRAVNCDVDRKVIETAIEAYIANTGVAPQSQADLVPVYLRVTSLGFDVVDGQVMAVPGVCA